RLAPLDRAGPDALSFLVARAYLPEYRRTAAGAVLVAQALAAEAIGQCTRILVARPEDALQRAAELLHPSRHQPHGIDPTARLAPDVEFPADGYLGPYAVIGAGARLGARVVVEAGAWVGEDVVIGDDSVIGPHAVCYPGALLGRRVVLKAGAVVGGPGFRFLSGLDGHRRVPHLGACVLEDDVEIGSGSCVDRGSFEDTVIGAGTKIDNLVQVAHNVRMGKRCLVAGTTGIAGSVRIGDDVVIAGGVGIADHVTVGNRAVLSAKSVVIGPVADGETVGGYPARPHRIFLRAQAALYRLPDVLGRLEKESTGAADRRSPG
ncbi:MAG TPA: UDP-3-O-(3-hydroxymyristoyl)glucosamine N-acyltransferase, partial [Gemmatimonadales bacterium]|nr:UDP-3-O-(3-hydroxymyristoyl)glucosamine N-acyltransferase [Gemmatimonadales bacterium]